ncbi:hypothetical protein MHU86_20340 [Fragilaria crotonensis]|nr:hypothetical protein MHU86_20340 [Fragilaria crotonensis]
MSHGVFAPLTADGTIVVNGVVTFNHAYVLLTHPDEPSDYIYWNNRLWRGASDENRKFKFMTQHGFMHMTCSPLRIMALGISPWFGTLSNHEGMNYLSCAYVQAYTWWKQSASSGTAKTSSSRGGIVKSRFVSAFGFLAWYFMFGIAWISYGVECLVGPTMSPTVIGLVVMMAATIHIKNKSKHKRMDGFDLKVKTT